MANSLYARKVGEVCRGCNHRNDSETHRRICIPRYKWDGETKPKRVVVDGKVYDADKVPGGAGQSLPNVSIVLDASHNNLKMVVGDSVFESASVCDCGYSARSAQAMSMHRQRSKQHKAVEV